MVYLFAKKGQRVICTASYHRDSECDRVGGAGGRGREWYGQTARMPAGSCSLLETYSAIETPNRMPELSNIFIALAGSFICSLALMLGR